MTATIPDVEVIDQLDWKPTCTMLEEGCPRDAAWQVWTDCCPDAYELSCEPHHEVWPRDSVFDCNHCGGVVSSADFHWRRL